MEPDDLLSLMGARRGHFVFESGYHGDLWLDLDAMFAAPAQLGGMPDDLSRRIAAVGPDVVCGPLTGGALVAFAVASKLKVGFRWTYREQMPSSQGLFPYRYHPNAPGTELIHRRVVVVDDVINAGSATRETLRLLREQNATPVAIGALLALGPNATHLVTVYGDGRQLSLVVMPAASRSGLPPEAIALVDKADRLAVTLDRSTWDPDAAQRREWTFLACISAHDAIRHARRTGKDVAGAAKPGGGTRVVPSKGCGTGALDLPPIRGGEPGECRSSGATRTG